MTAPLPATLAEMVVRGGGIPSLADQLDGPDNVLCLLESAAERIGDVPRPVLAEAALILLRWAERRRAAIERDARLGLRDAIEAGDTGEDGEPIPYPKHYSL